MSNKLLDAETHWQTHIPLSVMAAAHRSIYLDEKKTSPLRGHIFVLCDCDESTGNPQCHRKWGESSPIYPWNWLRIIWLETAEKIDPEVGQAFPNKWDNFFLCKQVCPMQGGHRTGELGHNYLLLFIYLSLHLPSSWCKCI